MELLVAMMSGAAGGAILRGPVRLGLATGLGITAGALAWYLLALVGPGLNAGPVVLVHTVAGAIFGAAALAGAGLARRRLGR